MISSGPKVDPARKFPNVNKGQCHGKTLQNLPLTAEKQISHANWTASDIGRK